MKKNSLYIAGICAALSVGALGCASSAKAGDKENKPAVEDTKAAGETTAAETSESNTVIEKNASSGPASGTGKKVSSEFICVYGPVSEVTSDSVTIDNQSGISSAGEMVITFSPETPIFDAETGNPGRYDRGGDGNRCICLHRGGDDDERAAYHERTALLRPCNRCERRAGLHRDRVGEKECRE